MNWKKIYSLPLFAAVLLVGCEQRNEVPLRDATDTLSWAVGRDFAKSMQKDKEMALNGEVVLAAIRATLEGDAERMPDSVLLAATQRILNQRKEAGATPIYLPQQVQQQEQQYFARLVKEKPNVRRHPEGFYYEVLREGTGPSAGFGSVVRFDYRSYLLLTGEPFDQTYGQRDPIVHVLGKPMFEGLVAGLQLMNRGSQYRFYFSYKLAFGEKQSGNIPPCTPLIYEVELHDIN